MAQGIYSRFSPAELAKLQSKAEEAGMTQSAFVRAAALQALKQGDLETRITVAVQAEVSRALDYFLDHYEQAQASAADAMSTVLNGIMATTKQAIAPPKVDQEAEVIRQIQDRARRENRTLFPDEAHTVAKLKKQIQAREQSATRAAVPQGAPD